MARTLAEAYVKISPDLTNFERPIVDESERAGTRGGDQAGNRIAERLNAKMRELHLPEIDVNANPTDALNDIDRVQDKLRTLARESPSVSIRLEANEALARMEAFKVALRNRAKEAGEDAGSAASRGFENKFDIGNVIALTLGVLATRFALLGAAAAGAIPSIINLAGSLFSLSGLLVAAPALALAAAAGFGVIALAFAGLGSTIKAGLSGDWAKFQEGLAKLPPNAQAVALAIVGMRDQFDQLRRAVGQNFFAGIAEEIQALAGKYMPLLQQRLPEIASGFNSIARAIFEAARNGPLFNGINDVLKFTAIGLNLATGGAAAFTNSLGILLSVGAPVIARLGAGFTQVGIATEQWLIKARDSGKLSQWLEAGITTLKLLFQIMVNIGSIFVSVFQAGASTGKNLLVTIRDLTAQFAAWLKTADGIKALNTTFTTLNKLGEAFRQVFGATLSQVGQSLQTLAPVIQQLAPIAAKFIVALLPAASVFVGIGVALTPLLPLLNAFANFLVANPALVQAMAAAIFFGMQAYKALTLAVAAYNIVMAITGNETKKTTVAIALQRIEAIAVAGATKVAAIAQALWNVAISSSTASTIKNAVATVAARVATIAVAVATGIATAAQWAWNVAMSANPIGLIIIAIAALIAIIVLIATHWTTFKNIAVDAWHSIQNVVGIVVNWFTSVVGPLMIGVWNGISAGALFMWHNAVEPAWRGIQVAVQFVWTVVQGIFGLWITWIQLLGSFFVWLWVNISTPVWSGILLVWQFALAAWQGIVAVYNASINFFASIWGFLWSNIMLPVWGGIIAVWQFALAMWNGIIVLFNISINFFSALWGFIWFNVMLPIWNGIIGVWQFGLAMWNGIIILFNVAINFFASLWQFIWFNIMLPVWNGIIGVWQFGLAMWNAIIQLFAAAINFFAGLWQFIWFSIMIPVWNGLVGVWLFGLAMWNAIVGLFAAAVNFFASLWQFIWFSIMIPVWNGIVATWQFGLAMWNAIVGLFAGVINFFAGLWQFLWFGIMIPVWNGIISTWQFGLAMWSAISNLIGAVINALAAAWQNFLNIMIQVWNGIINTWQFGLAMWRAIADLTIGVINNLAAAWQSFYSNVIVPVWNAIKDHINATFQWIANNVFGPLMDLVQNKIPGAFNTAVEAIRIAWDKIRGFCHDPIHFVINTVYNHGIVPVWNFIASKVSLPTLNEFTFAATGGRLSGPGTGTSDDIPVMASDGEYIVNARATKKHLGTLEAINSGQPVFDMAYMATGGMVNKWNRKNHDEDGLGGSDEQSATRRMPGMEIEDFAKAVAMACGGRVGSQNNGLLEEHRNHVHVAMNVPKMGFQHIIDVGMASGVPHGPVVSTFRPGSTGSGGGLDHHSEGRAVDWGGYNQDAFAQFWCRTPGVIELIHRTATQDYAIFGGGLEGADNAGICIPNPVRAAFDALWKPIKALWLAARETGALKGETGFKPEARGAVTKWADAIEKFAYDKIPAQLCFGGGDQGVGDCKDIQGIAIEMLKKEGFNPSLDLGPLMALIKRESACNPNAINRTDSNAQAGHPSQGLMQTIPQTFNAFRDPSVPGGITDPAANIAAGLRYIKSRYGGHIPTGPGGYDNGGGLNPGFNYVYNGTGRVENVTTHDKMEDVIDRLEDLIEATKDIAPGLGEELRGSASRLRTMSRTR